MHSLSVTDFPHRLPPMTDAPHQLYKFKDKSEDDPKPIILNPVTNIRLMGPASH